jgi:hypothetical protein
MQGNLLGLRRQRREDHARAAEERAEREAQRNQAEGVQAGQPLTMAEQEHVSGMTCSHSRSHFRSTGIPVGLLSVHLLSLR